MVLLAMDYFKENDALIGLPCNLKNAAKLVLAYKLLLANHIGFCCIKLNFNRTLTH